MAGYRHAVRWRSIPVRSIRSPRATATSWPAPGRLFDRIIVLLAVNPDKRPTAEAAARAARVREAIPAGWGNVEVDTWTGLTTAYCVHRSASVIVRGVRTPADLRHEYQLAAMNEQLGIQTVWLPTRPHLAATSSTVVRAYRSA